MKLRPSNLAIAVLASALMPGSPLVEHGFAQRRIGRPARMEMRRVRQAQRRPPPPRRQGQPNRAHPPDTPLERWESMTPQQRQRFLNNLPPERRRRFEGRLQELQNMPPQQRQRLHEQYRRFEQLPPERQERIRNLYRRFSNQPPARQDLMRGELQQLRSMPPEERQARFQSDDFQGKFKPNEQEILRKMTNVLPPDMNGPEK